MNERLNDILRFDDDARELFKRSINRILSDTFILREIKDGEPLYNFVIRNREAFEAYLECAGWTLRIDETTGVVSWKGGASSRYNFSKDETIALAVARMIYEEKRGELSLHAFPVVTLSDFQEKYKAVTGGMLRKTRFAEVMRRLASFRLARVLGSELDPEADMVLYPSLAFAIDAAAVNDIVERIKNSSSRDEGAEETCEDD